MCEIRGEPNHNQNASGLKRCCSIAERHNMVVAVETLLFSPCQQCWQPRAGLTTLLAQESCLVAAQAQVQGGHGRQHTPAPDVTTTLTARHSMSQHNTARHTVSLHTIVLARKHLVGNSGMVSSGACPHSKATLPCPALLLTSFHSVSGCPGRDRPQSQAYSSARRLALDSSPSAALKRK